jgi:predicted O-methyltransferase YrrM
LKEKNKMDKGAMEDKFAFDELSNLINKYKVKRIIETGTYFGWSTQKFCSFGIEVDSIEINKEFYEKVKKNLNFENLKLHLGNSIDILPDIIKEKEEGILIFIDSHWSDLPLLEELKILNLKKIKPIILIHDFFVPDKNGNAKFGFDTYNNVKLDFNLIKVYIDKIYNNKYKYHYTSQIDCVNSGTIYIYPIIENDESN